MTGRFVRAPGVLSRDITDAVLVLVRGGSGVLSLSGAGTEIWRMLQSPRTLEELLTMLSDRFEVPVEVINDDVRGTLDHLVAARLVHQS